MKGIVNGRTISIKLDGEKAEVKDRLNQLYDTVIDEFGLTKKASIIWEQKRDSFIQAINAIPHTRIRARTVASSFFIMVSSSLSLDRGKQDAFRGFFRRVWVDRVSTALPLDRLSLAVTPPFLRYMLSDPRGFPASKWAAGCAAAAPVPDL